MKTNKNKKSGFTLVELMIVAAIIAILAAILVPLMTSNKDRGIAAEAATICGTVATEAKVIYATTGAWPTKAEIAAGTVDEDIDKGRYFTWAQVTVADGGVVTVTGDGTSGSAGKGFSTAASETLTLTPGTGYSGSMVTKKWVAQ